tara:strand:- start:708 stop:1427 length:720 start_codon:yes stop_codon:yes gene_type:complete
MRILLKAVILAGGYGTRISEESNLRPKPMIEIGGKPILWHIMKIYSTYGINEFVICCGYKASIIQKYFSENNAESWDVKTVDTGLDTMTGGRIKRIEKFVDGQRFYLSYGDDLKKVNISELVRFHEKQKKMVTMTITKPEPRYGVVKINNDLIVSMKEKSREHENWINGGYFVLEPKIFEQINGDKSQFENDVLTKLTINEQVSGFKYLDNYYPLDTSYDKTRLEKLWDNNKAYWKIWE